MVKPKKHLGQHFLIGPGIADRIAQSITCHNRCNSVLEVGPGTGALTLPLLERGDLDLHVVELDTESADFLVTEELLPSERVHGVDLLSWNPDMAFPNNKPFIVAGNFPYNISSQILFQVIDWRERVPELVGMFQKEVAQRIAEGPGSRTYGILSVLLQTYYDIDPICGPSRMCAYTGRYVSSHGSTSNFTPLRIGEKNIGHHLNPLGMRTVLVGKTHVVPDREGLERLGIDPDGEAALYHAQGGFEVYERDDGIHPDIMVKPNVPYNQYLKSQGYDEDDNPWHWAANSVETETGEVRWVSSTTALTCRHGSPTSNQKPRT